MKITYIYPQNLKAAVKLWLWNFKDFAIIFIAVLISIFALINGIFIFAVATFVYAILTITPEDTSIMDFLKRAVRYFFSVPQTFFWKERLR